MPSLPASNPRCRVRAWQAARSNGVPHCSCDSTGTYPPIGHNGLPYSIVDVVKVPSDLEPGEYLLSWRWDCEQSHQIWQNCADVRIVVDESVEEA
mmetsp:Transcript_23878/g.64045  ORF Transcript_23878/g.64045 Transcript_23878/m.64045 type:complete len:95 (+) Transcript_23878:1102-1386(+)